MVRQAELLPNAKQKRRPTCQTFLARATAGQPLFRGGAASYFVACGSGGVRSGTGEETTMELAVVPYNRNSSSSASSSVM